MRFRLAQVSKKRSFATREAAANIRSQISSQALVSDDDSVEVDLRGIEAITVSFADELFAKLAVERQVFGDEESFFFISNATPEIAETIEVALERRGLIIAHRSQDGSFELLAAGSHLIETFEAAQELGEFTARDLAAVLGITPPAANNRIKLLAEAGAVARVRQDPARGGRQFVYLARAA